MSPTPAAGSLFNLEPAPLTEMTFKLRAPELSQQLMTAPTGRPSYTYPLVLCSSYSSVVPGWSYLVVYSLFSTSKHTDRFTESSSFVLTYSHLVFVTGSSSLLRHLLLLSFFDVWWCAYLYPLTSWKKIPDGSVPHFTTRFSRLPPNAHFFLVTALGLCPKLGPLLTAH